MNTAKAAVARARYSPCSRNGREGDDGTDRRGDEHGQHELNGFPSPPQPPITRAPIPAKVIGRERDLAGVADERDQREHDDAERQCPGRVWKVRSLVEDRTEREGRAPRAPADPISQRRGRGDGMTLAGT